MMRLHKKKSTGARLAWNSPVRKKREKTHSASQKKVFIPLELVKERLNSLQSQANFNNETASIYASFYRVAKIIRKAKDAGSPIKSQLELEGIISWEFMRSSDPNYSSSQQELEKELKEECIKLWETTFEKEVS